MSDVVSHIIERLELIRDNWSTLGSIRSKHTFGDIDLNSGRGICSNAQLMNLPYRIYIDMLEAWPNVAKGYGGMPDCHFPVGGANEYYNFHDIGRGIRRMTASANLYTNPKRLEFVEHCIKYLTDNKESIKIARTNV